ncbi:hypothetical protein J6590_067179 [Homalodisca vitripennis]|nr:hypothetical protein J6590_067179 [Homalodisca vitripennis]
MVDQSISRLTVKQSSITSKVGRQSNSCVTVPTVIDWPTPYRRLPGAGCHVRVRYRQSLTVVAFPGLYAPRPPSQPADCVICDLVHRPRIDTGLDCQSGQVLGTPSQIVETPCRVDNTRVEPCTSVCRWSDKAAKTEWRNASQPTVSVPCDMPSYCSLIRPTTTLSAIRATVYLSMREYITETVILNVL